jgi:hypothetical protein
VDPLPSCTCGEAIETTYSWVIFTYSLIPSSRVLNAYQTSSPTVQLRKTNNGGKLKAFESGDHFVLTLNTSWKCGGDCVQASYEVEGTYGSLPPIARNTSYTATTC